MTKTTFTFMAVITLSWSLMTSCSGDEWYEKCLDFQDAAVYVPIECPRAIDGGPPTVAQRWGLTYETMPRPVTSGGLSWYAAGVFDQVVDPANEMSAINLSYEELNKYDGFIAVAECWRVGQAATLRHTESGRSWRVLVADCAGPLDLDNGYPFLVYNRLIGEVDWELAVETGITEGSKYGFTLSYDN